MANIEDTSLWIEDLELCVDCAVMIATGEDHSLDGDLVDQIHGKGWGPFYFALSGTREEFSAAPCDACGSRLAGERHGATGIPSLN